MEKFYDEFADWWYLISDPADYAEEATYFLQQFAPITTRKDATLLELGSGGGNNASHMKQAFAHTTLTDLSPRMIALSQNHHPDCEHIVADMRTLKLDREFDAVFIHDAIDYMTTQADLRQALQTAYDHCKTGGMVLVVPDATRETFEPDTDHGGHDGDNRSARYLEWSFDPDPTDDTTITDYVFILREGDAPPITVHERHTLGLFSRDIWVQIMQEVGFRTTMTQDPYERDVFIGAK